MAEATKKDQPRKLSIKEQTEQEIKERYDKGESMYSIAKAVYDFDSDEAVGRVREVLGVFNPESRVMED